MPPANTLKEPKKVKAPGKRGGFSRFFSSLLDGTILTREKVEGMLPFFLFLTLLAIVLIFNTYYAEKKARRVENLRDELVELRVRYITTKSELMYISNQSEVARMLRDKGFVESTVPPRPVVDLSPKRGMITRILTGNNR
jgi:hypothetical protein